MSVADDIYDGTIRNQVALRRYINGQVLATLALFEKYDRKLAALLRKHHRANMTVFSAEYKAMLQALKELRAELIKEASATLHTSLEELVPVEHDKEWALLALLLGIKRKQPSPITLSKILKQPFSSGAASAATFDQWVKDLGAADFKRLRDAVTLGVTEEMSTNDLVATVVGTKDEGFRDGAAAVTRHNARALVTTVIAHVSTAARVALWANVSKVTGGMWSSILDSATTAICRRRDGKVAVFNGQEPPDGAVLLDPQSARPPAHVGCRSTFVAIYKSQLPDRISYNDWIRRQSTDVQDDILGQAKGEMFRQGRLTLDNFVDNSGKVYTLQDLKSQGIQ